MDKKLKHIAKEYADSQPIPGFHQWVWDLVNKAVLYGIETGKNLAFDDYQKEIEKDVQNKIKSNNIDNVKNILADQLESIAYMCSCFDIKLSDIKNISIKGGENETEH